MTDVELACESPPDCSPGYKDHSAINPHDKHRRNAGLSVKESIELSGVCEFGPDQLLTCYKDCDNNCNRLSFWNMCKSCKYRMRRWDQLYDSFDGSIWSPDFFERWASRQGFLCDDGRWFVYFVSDGEYVKIG